MILEKWILEELEDMPIDVLEDSFNNGLFNPLLINDGHIIGFENAETPGAATPRESK